MIILGVLVIGCFIEVACSAGIFFGCAIVFACENAMLELSKERRKWDKSNEVWEGVEREKRKHFFVPSPPPFPFFALAPTLRVTIFTLPNLPPS